MANPSNRSDPQSGQVREHTDAAKAHLQQAGNDARQGVDAAKSHLQQAGSEAKQAAVAAASGLAHSAEEKTDQALASMGQRMSTVAGSLRQAAPRQGVASNAASVVAEQLDSGGRYLQEHGVSAITDDIAGAIRRNPLPALAIAFGIGLCIGLTTRR